MSQRIFLPQEKIIKVQRAVSTLHETEEASLRTIMRILGLMSSYFPVVHWAQFHFRRLQGFLLSSWDGIRESLDLRVYLSGEVKKLPRLVAQFIQPVGRSDLDPTGPTERD